jgi:hypothetical protein
VLRDKSKQPKGFRETLRRKAFSDLRVLPIGRSPWRRWTGKRTFLLKALSPLIVLIKRPEASGTLHGTQEQSFLLEHSTSRGLSQGIQIGIGFSEKHGAGNSMAVHVPGMQTDALPMLIQGMM